MLPVKFHSEAKEGQSPGLVVSADAQLGKGGANGGAPNRYSFAPPAAHHLSRPASLHHYPSFLPTPLSFLFSLLPRNRNKGNGAGCCVFQHPFCCPSPPRSPPRLSRYPVCGLITDRLRGLPPRYLRFVSYRCSRQTFHQKRIFKILPAPRGISLPITQRSVIGVRRQHRQDGQVRPRQSCLPLASKLSMPSAAAPSLATPLGVRTPCCRRPRC